MVTWEDLEWVFAGENPPVIHWGDRPLNFDMRIWRSEEECSACAWGFAYLHATGYLPGIGPGPDWDIGPRTELAKRLLDMLWISYTHARTIFRGIPEDGTRFLLQGVDLQGADLREADLRGADLQGADLREADLRGADLQGANLQGANLEGANLEGANLEGADIQDAIQ